ncbi:Serine/threonine-protein phosphatase 7 long form-like protein [Hordeum vulgare]|nr:Serine/threonine-protein phosphatase 7 long form-like protein [Hordeum vulgare]
MAYVVRYESFECAGLLQFVLQFKRVPPVMNHASLTALLDSWQPETHKFHLPCGEMTVTLEDFARITWLPIDDQALTGRVDKKNWRQRVTALIGLLYLSF